MNERELFDNITVVSLEQATVLPYLTWRLVQQGAKVIRIEHPVYGDPNRRIGDNALNEDRMFSYFLPINSGKNALTLDLSTMEGKEIFQKLIIELKVDIFATNQLPRSYQKLGIDYENLKNLKSDIIWLGMTGFGPSSNEAAYDPVIQAKGGLMELTGEKDGAPQVVGIPLSDMGTSEHAFGELMKALFKRAVTGEGSRIDISMFQSTASWATTAITFTKTFGKKVSRRGNTHAFFAPVSVYPTEDGFVYFAIGNDRQWETLTALSEFKQLAKEKYIRNAGRIAEVNQINTEISKVMKTKTSGEWISIFHKATIPISKVNNIEEVTEDPLIKDVLLYSEDPVTGVTLTLSPPPVVTDFIRKENFRLSFPPRFGEHNEAIYVDKLGYSKDQLNDFRNRKII